MRNASDRFATAAIEGGRWSPLVKLRTDGQDIADEFPISDGTLVLDADAATTAELRLKIPADDPRWLPMRKDADLFIVDTRARVQLGWQYPNGKAERLDVASVWVSEIEVFRPNDRLELTARSRESRLLEDPFIRGMSFGKSQSIRSAVFDVFQGTLPGSTAIHERGGADLSDSVPRGIRFAAGDDRFTAVERLLQAADTVGYFDTNDDLVVTPPFEVADRADVVLKTGPNGNTSEVRTRFTRDGYANRVRMIYSSQEKRTPNVVGNWQNDDPITGANGRMGRLGLVVDRKGPISQAKANSAASRYGRRRSALPRDVTVSMVPDPRIELGDTVEVRYVSGGQTRFVVRRIELPLTPGPMTLSGRGDVLATRQGRHGG